MRKDKLMRNAMHGAVLFICALLSQAGVAGEQQYEALSANVRAMLHHSVADRASPRLTFESQTDGAVWLAEMSKRLENHIPEATTRHDFLVTLQYEASRAGLDPQLVLSVIQVESKFRKYAVSKAGARGYMQVMPFWVKLIGDSQQNLFNLRTNLRYGCTILRHYLTIEHGDMVRTLARYNGSLGQSRYSNNVLRAWSGNWDYARGKPTIIIAPTRYVGEGG